MENITELSELCRLCLEASNFLIGFDTGLYFTTKTIPELIRFCLDINCSIGEGILPTNLCQSCLEKLQATFEFKHKSKESEKYLKEILLSNTEEVEAEEPEITPYNPPPYYQNEDSNDLLEETQHKSQPRKKEKPDKSFEPRNGLKSGLFPCNLCDKTFKYIKPFKAHMKQHQSGQVANGASTKKRKNKKKIGFAIKPSYKAAQEQAPYDSRSPYESPAPYDSPVREESPEIDMAMMMVNSDFLNGEDDQPNGSKTEKMKLLPAKPETSVAVATNSKGRGRPKKKALKGFALRKFQQAEAAKVEAPTPLADFTEVDIGKMLKSKDVFLVDESIPQSAPSTSHSRSRSSSVEMVQEFDIFGTVIPNRSPVKKKSAQISIPCKVRGCNEKFHLRANLRRHQREAHSIM